MFAIGDHSVQLAKRVAFRAAGREAPRVGRKERGFSVGGGYPVRVPPTTHSSPRRPCNARDMAGRGIRNRCFLRSWHLLRRSVSSVEDHVRFLRGRHLGRGLRRRRFRSRRPYCISYCYNCGNTTDPVNGGIPARGKASESKAVLYNVCWRSKLSDCRWNELSSAVKRAAVQLEQQYQYRIQTQRQHLPNPTVWQSTFLNSDTHQ